MTGHAVEVPGTSKLLNPGHQSQRSHGGTTNTLPVDSPYSNAERISNLKSEVTVLVANQQQLHAEHDTLIWQLKGIERKLKKLGGA